MRHLLLASILSGAACASTSAGVTSTSAGVTTNAWGAHGVGVARTAHANLEVTYWYPSQQGGRVARLSGFSQQSPALVDALIGAGLSAAAAREYIESSVRARWDAPRKAGRFPLVLIGQGNQHDALDQAVLAEIVASHGFVVATIPSPMLTSPMRSADDVGPFAQRHAEGLVAAAARLAALGVADDTSIAVVGHSFGARAALLVAMHDSRVKALVSLDGGIGTATAQESFAQAPWFLRARATVPILHFYESADSFMAPDFSLLRSLPSRELTLRELADLRHAHFTTIGFTAAADPEMRRVTGMGPEGPAALHAMVSELVRFLTARLR